MRFMYRLLYMASGASGLLALAQMLADKPSKTMAMLSLTAFAIAYLVEGSKE